MNSYLINPVVKANMPAEASFFYGKPYSLGTAPFPYLFLYAIKKPEPKPILDESFLTAVRLQPGLRLDEQQVVFKFNRTGTSRLERMTTANINRYIAMVANNEVITAPRVEGAISGGSMVFSAIDGHDPKLVYLLVKYGPLPAPIGIRQLQFAVQPAPSLLKGIWPLVWLLAFALAFLLTLSIDRAFRNMYRERRQ